MGLFFFPGVRPLISHVSLHRPVRRRCWHRAIGDSSSGFMTEEGLVAGASLADIDASTMGARMDPGASAAFLFCIFLFGGLRFKVVNAVAAKEERLRQELVVQEARVAALDNPESARKVEMEMTQLSLLRQKEERARTLTLLPGVAVRVMVPTTTDPDLFEVEKRTLPGTDDEAPISSSTKPSTSPGSSTSPLNPGSSSSKIKLTTEPTFPRKEEDSQSLGSGKRIIIAAVFVTQVLLLWVLSFDPMAPPSAPFGDSFDSFK